MPRYHFNVHDDLKGTSPDWDGIELPDLMTAQREAVRFAGESIAQSALHRRHGGDWHLKVTDGTGCPLFVLDFRILPAPAPGTDHGLQGQDPRTTMDWKQAGRLS